MKIRKKPAPPTHYDPSLFEVSLIDNNHDHGNSPSMAYIDTNENSFLDVERVMRACWLKSYDRTNGQFIKDEDKVYWIAASEHQQLLVVDSNSNAFFVVKMPSGHPAAVKAEDVMAVVLDGKMFAHNFPNKDSGKVLMIQTSGELNHSPFDRFLISNNYFDISKQVKSVTVLSCENLGTTTLYQELCPPCDAATLSDQKYRALALQPLKLFEMTWPLSMGVQDFIAIEYAKQTKNLTYFDHHFNLLERAISGALLAVGYKMEFSLSSYLLDDNYRNHFINTYQTKIRFNCDQLVLLNPLKTNEIEDA